MLESISYALKSATRRLVKLSGGAVAVADELAVSAGHLSRQQSPQYEDLLRLDQVVRLEAIAGVPAITEIMAAANGYRLVKSDDADEAPLTLDDLTRFLGRSGEFGTTFSGALADKVVDAHEGRQLNAQIEALVKELRAVQGKINTSTESRT